MTREYEFAALIYDEEKHEIHYKAGGRWVCGKCLPGFGDVPTQCTLCSTAKAAAER